MKKQNNAHSLTTVPNYWLVIDMVRVPDALALLSQQVVIEQVYPLYAGSSFSYALELSPMLVNVGSDRDRALSTLSLPDIHSSAVLFEVSGETEMATFIAHLQAMLLVYVNNQQRFTRFYTNEFWDANALALNEKDKCTLLGSADTVYWLSSVKQCQSLSRPDGDRPSAPYYLTSPIFKQ